MNLENFQYHFDLQPCNKVEKLLSETIYGTPGGLLLQHKDVSKKLDAILGAEYHTLWQENELCAVAVYCKRAIILENLNKNTNAYYIRYFSVNTKFQNKGIGKLLTQKIETYYRKNILEPTVFYAYIENKNLKSQSVSNHFEPKKMGVFSPVYFSRFFPKKHPNIIHTKDKTADVLLQKKYKSYTLYSKVADDKYFKKITSINNSVIQCSIVNWEIHNYPTNNFLMQNVLPKIPFLNRLAEGKQMRFIAVEQYCYENTADFFNLLEHILSLENIYKAMIYLDHTDANFEELIKSNQLGMMDKIQKRPSITMQTFFLNCDENIQNEIIKSTKYISGFDVT